MHARLLALDRRSGRTAFSAAVTTDPVAAQQFYDEAIAAGHEGVMAKSLDSLYEAGNRGASWFKVKRAHTLDLVVLAAEWGNGRRTGKLSNLHLGALDPATGEYVMLGKTFKGLTDAMLELADEGVPGSRERRDERDGLRPSRARRGDRLQRLAGEFPLSRWARAALGARQALSRRQDGRGGGHDGVSAPHLRGAGRSLVRMRSIYQNHYRP